MPDRTSNTKVLTAVTGDRFGWPAGRELIALDTVVLTLPMELLDESKPMSECLDAHDDIGIDIPSDGDAFHIRLTPGQWASPRRSCQAKISGEPGVTYRFKLASESKASGEP
ncbi:hypothetical protein [Neorhodopirellula pilleata]|uniref:hypothetical protein n=1 Tax=Neorhodopirellula pilleata TaxID=2714738 RepID=UPI0011B67519|nr:hypothetical protein [Neorhodopirellula pilleata]